MAVLLPNGKQSFINAAGLPLVGGKVFTYAAGTNNPLPTYSDAAQTVPNTNPIILDARGEATIFWSGTYKVVLQDALGNLIYSVDNLIAAAIDTTLRADIALPTGAILMGYKESGAGAVNLTVDAAFKMLPINPKSLGAKFDGATDDTAALQAGINAADATGRILILPPGTAMISAPLDLKGREVTIIGAGPDRSTIKASAAMATMLDLTETADQQFLRCDLSGFALEGGNVAALGWDLRYRHNTSFRNLRVLTCTTGLRERDAWNNYREQVRVVNCPTGINLAGANHSSLWVKCGVNGSTSVALNIDIASTAGDGNKSPKFDTCNFDFNSGTTINVSGSAQVLFENCYVGENCSAPSVVNSGSITFRNGTLFVGYTAANVVRAAAGDMLFERVQVNDQGNGNLSSLFAQNALDSGTVAYRDCVGNVPINPVLINGAPFGRLPGRVYAPTIARGYALATSGGAAGSLTINGDAVTVTVTAAPGGSILSLWNALTDDWSREGPVYLLPTYSSDMGAVARLSNGPLGASQVLVNLPATANAVRSMPVLGTTPNPAGTYTVLEFTMPTLVIGAKFTLYHAYFSDTRFQNTRGATFANIGVIG